VYILTVVLAGIVAGGFLALGLARLAGHRRMAEARAHLDVPKGLWTIIGALEVAGATGVLLGLHEALPIIGVLAAAGLIALTIGAVSYHQKAGDAFADWLPAVAMGSMSIFFIIARIASS
jgi:hypothetical protein